MKAENGVWSISMIEFMISVINAFKGLEESEKINIDNI